jgi:hypothetical protein
MTVNLADAPQFPVRATAKERVISGMTVAVGAAGATTETDSDDAKWTCAAFASGVAAITFPACPSGRLRFAIKSAAATVTECIATALDVTAGTGTLTTSKAGVATTPASGDKIFVELIGTVAP